MKRKSAIVTFCSLAVLGAGLRATEPSPSDVAEMLVQRHAAAIVRVSMVVKLSGNVGGREMPAREIKHEAWATVISPDGLAVVSLAAIDPTELLGGLAGNRGGLRIELAAAEFKLVRLHWPDGSEAPARVVLKDTDLDIAFIKPITPPAPPAACLDLRQDATPRLLSTGYILGRATTANQGVPMVRRADIISLTEKPRRRIVPEVSQVSCPMFTADDRVYGICARQFVNGRPAGFVVLPAADIAEIAKQADAITPQPEETTPPEPPAPGKDAAPAAPAAKPDNAPAVTEKK